MRKFFYSLLLLLSCATLVACDEEPRTYGAEPLEISSLRQWERVHRPAIYNFFETEVYGRMPEKSVPISYELLTEGAALGGKAVRREVAMLSLAIAEQVVRKDLKSDQGQRQLVDTLVEEVSSCHSGRSEGSPTS